MALVTCRECTAAAPGTAMLVQRNAVATFLAGSASFNGHGASFNDVEDPIILERKMDLPDPNVRVSFQVSMEAWQSCSCQGIKAYLHQKPIKDKQLEEHAEHWVIKQCAPAKGHSRTIDMGCFSVHPHQAGSQSPSAPMTP